jgi:[acyl-carrier-protein] S-malonyltransferase
MSTQVNHALAIVFPGQGSQAVGMLADLAATHSEIKQTFDEASTVLGFDLWTLCQQGPAEELDKTTNTQPALLTASYAMWRAWGRISPTPIAMGVGEMRPQFLAGHSLGEYTALVCAKSLNFQDAVRLVAARGQFMQDAVAVDEGAMAALIGLDDEKVKTICEQARLVNEVLSPANYNSVGQIVVAGHKASVEHAVTLAKEQGAKLAVMIPVSVPSHCSLMLPAAENLRELLTTVAFHEPAIPVISNVDVKPYTGAASIRDGLMRQLTMPVRWVETIQYFTQHGVTQVLECGPGKVLTGLNKRIDKNLQLGNLL